ncbi:MAG: hypothetical protein ACR2MN_00155 [Acidimicrobiales bacterium]
MTDGNRSSAPALGRAGCCDRRIVEVALSPSGRAVIDVVSHAPRRAVRQLLAIAADGADPSVTATWSHGAAVGA